MVSSPTAFRVRFCLVYEVMGLELVNRRVIGGLFSHKGQPSTLFARS